MPTSKIRSAVAFACALGFALVAVPQAAAKVYWTNNTTNTIGAANLAGTDVNQSLIVAGGGPYGLAVRDSVLYWSNNSSIGRADIFGPMFSQNFITATNPRGVAIDGNYVYWATDTAGVDTIARANLDGTGTNQNFITGVDDPEGVAVDGGHIYWANSGLARIGRANLDGTSKNQNFITTGGGPFGVAVDGGHIYWANLFNDTIARANLDGTNVNQSFITGASSPRGVAVDGQHVYWGNTGPNTIGRANLDGSGVNQSLIATANFPYGVAVTPLDTGITQGPSGTITSSAATFAFAASEPAGFECRLDTQPLAACGSQTTYSSLANGPHVLQVRARDSAGNVDPTPAARAFVVNAPVVNAPDTTKPKLTNLKLSRTRFSAAASGSALAKATAKSGVKVSYTLTEVADVRFTVERRKAGRVVNGKCRARTNANERRKKCDLKLKGSATHKGKLGKNSLRFRGRLNGRRISRGNYYLIATAKDAAGNTASRKKVKFTIVKR